MSIAQAIITKVDNEHLAEIAELKSQVEDLQEELIATRTASNMKDWQIRFLKEDVKRLYAKSTEKYTEMKTKHTEGDD